MQIKKFVASGLAGLMAGATLAGAALAATQLGNVLNTVGQQAVSGTPYLVVVGANAAPSDVVGAIDVASAVAQQMYTKEQVPGVTVSKLTGGVSLDTADKHIYFEDAINNAKEVLTSNDLPTLLAGGTIEDDEGNEYDYTAYLKVGERKIEFKKDTAAGIDNPVYLIDLGTSASSASDSNPSTFALEAWVSFNKAVNITKMTGKELTLFGKQFTISADSEDDTLVLYGISNKVTVGAGEEKTVDVGGTSHSVKVVGISNDKTAVIEVDGITKEVTEGKTYNFGSTKVYVSDVFYYEVPEKTGSVVVSIGADEYKFTDGSAVEHNGETIDGTHVALIIDGNVEKFSGMRIFFTGTSDNHYLTAGSTFEVPIFGIKLAYKGPTDSIKTEEISVSPDSSVAYDVSFTDKYDNRGTIHWAYYESGEKLADSSNHDIIVVEGQYADQNDYVFATSKDFPHMLQVTNIADDEVKLKDVMSGTEYDVPINGNSGTVVIDGQSYSVSVSDSKVALEDSNTSSIVVYPTLKTKYGAKIAFTKPLTGLNIVNGTKIVLPTGEYTVPSNASEWDNSTLPGYHFKLNNSGVTEIYVENIEKPALMIIEEPKTGENDGQAIILPVEYIEDDSKLELQSPRFTGNAESQTTSSSDVTDYVDTWGTKLVFDATNDQPTATVTYPDEQLYHQVAVGANPTWSSTTTSGATYNKIVPLTTTVAKLDSEITSAEKSNDNLILVGGPCVNSLVAELANSGKFPYTCDTWPAENFGMVKAIDDAFASGKLALVIAGTRAEDTRLATSVLSLGKLAGETSSSVKITGTTAAPTITPA